MTTQRTIRIPFYCPRCGGNCDDQGELNGGAVEASPTFPSIRCVGCGQAWCVALYPMRAASDGRWEEGDDE